MISKESMSKFKVFRVFFRCLSEKRPTGVVVMMVMIVAVVVVMVVVSIALCKYLRRTICSARLDALISVDYHLPVALQTKHSAHVCKSDD